MLVWGKQLGLLQSRAHGFWSRQSCYHPLVRHLGPAWLWRAPCARSQACAYSIVSLPSMSPGLRLPSPPLLTPWQPWRLLCFHAALDRCALSRDRNFRCMAQDHVLLVSPRWLSRLRTCCASGYKPQSFHRTIKHLCPCKDMVAHLQKQRPNFYLRLYSLIMCVW